MFALGYHNESYNNALKEQIDKLIHTSNYYYNVPAIEAAKKLKAVSGMDRVFFTNSGAEAIEGAIKAARKYAYLKRRYHRPRNHCHGAFLPWQNHGSAFRNGQPALQRGF